MKDNEALIRDIVDRIRSEGGEPGPDEVRLLALPKEGLVGFYQGTARQLTLLNPLAAIRLADLMTREALRVLDEEGGTH